MPLYRWNDANLEPVPPTTFEAEQLQEANLQRLLRDQPEVLEEGLFIVAEEFSNWQDSSRSIDLLALDSEGNLVVVELKRTQTGDHSELQAIRYAAMVANMRLDQIVDAHRAYLAKRGRDEDASLQVLNHLRVADEADAEIHTEQPRIILASAGFSTELTTSVLWLNNSDLNITCIRFRLYRSGEDTLVDADQVIPLPEASDYLVKAREKAEVERRQRSAHRQEIIPGGDAFLDAIDQVRDDYRPMMTQVFDWAVSLAQENLATLETRKGKLRTTLWINLPAANVRFATIWQNKGAGHLDLNANEIRARAPKASTCIAQILGSETYGGNYWSVPDGLLDALTDAYREANGLPPTTPPPDTGPGSLAPGG